MREVLRAEAACATEGVGEGSCWCEVGLHAGCLLRGRALGEGMNHVRDLVDRIFHVDGVTLTRETGGGEEVHSMQ